MEEIQETSSQRGKLSCCQRSTLLQLTRLYYLYRENMEATSGTEVDELEK